MEDTIRKALASVQTEDILVEAVRDLVKDEVKRYIRTKLDENPELKNEIKTAVGELMDAKVREYYAMARLAKSGVELGLEIMPAEMRERLTRDVSKLIEKEINQMFDKV